MVNVSCLWVAGCGKRAPTVRLLQSGTVAGEGAYMIVLRKRPQMGMHWHGLRRE